MLSMQPDYPDSPNSGSAALSDFAIRWRAPCHCFEAARNVASLSNIKTRLLQESAT